MLLVDITGTPSLSAMSKASGVKGFTLAFVNSYGCKASWFGAYDPRTAWQKEEIAKIRAAGGDVKISFGGASGIELAQACSTSAQVAAEYDAVVKAYGLADGKGVVRATPTEAILEGQFFMDTVGGQETFKVVKAMGDLQEWSYSCQADKWSYGEFDGKQVRFLEHIVPGGEVSPVIKGSGVGTRTTAVKGGLTFAGEAEAVLADLENLTDRAADVLGKGFGADSSALLSKVEAQCKRLAGLVAEPEPESTTPPALQVEYLRHIARTRGITV